MAISDKTRKILWARSGNRCAFCQQKLVTDKTDRDPESVIGEECHIQAQAENGPRHDSSISPDQIDSLDNLILLCPTHHKQVDDQSLTYTAESLCATKSDHEKWVETKLGAAEEPAPMRIIRSKSGLPQKLDRIVSGKVLLGMTGQSHSFNTQYDDDLDEGESDLVGSLLEDVVDYGDLASELSVSEQMRVARGLRDRLQELEQMGFYVFAGVEEARLAGGVRWPGPWRIFHIYVTRATNPNIRWTNAQ